MAPILRAQRQVADADAESRVKTERVRSQRRVANTNRMTQEVPWMDLVPGRQYRIKDIFYKNEPDKNEPDILGTFLSSYSYPIKRQNRIVIEVATMFNNVKNLHGINRYTVETITSFNPNTTIFYETAESIIANQVARGLSDSIPERNAYLVRQFLQGKDLPGKGVNRFPARTRTNRKKRKSRKH
jgi:hypothetical protein